MTRNGPLSDLRIVEFAGMGPGPFACMLLSDLGADVLRIDRADAPDPHPWQIAARGKRSLGLDLKDPAAVEQCRRIIERCDAVVEGYRPGVMERVGLGPDVALKLNPRLVYGRMTGWGQSGPLAQRAGHDLNYIAISGALHAIGPKDHPVPPLNLVGDYGGGALYLVMGLLAALHHAQRTGEGQVVDAAISDGAASLMSVFYGLAAEGRWQGERASNSLDGGAHYYGVFECLDGEWISIAAIEPQFYALLLERLEIHDEALRARQHDRQAWPELREKLAKLFRTRPRSAWCALLEQSDACFAPVLNLKEAVAHPHNVSRGTFVEVSGVVQPAPAPRFSATPGTVQGPPVKTGEGGRDVLREWGVQPVRPT
ncbi:MULTISPECIES: CaiB/BaiF CoA-transferase family protein [unclassified Phenylobacterium]|uniref:CaiB/BaiF CoA transferase family protein n=1 Tax=unclassified Phenylobacterium TaxID=2640670 RepID=UPI001A32C411|nr:MULTISPECIES: CaiB/BaiF CoA-transferase family protein [unclassified Phenylobacterium]MBJ7411288.1 CoA transferase [Phenylobacterium sp.]MCR5879871.1 CoA transferase [Phenylobacterium sp. J367]